MHGIIVDRGNRIHTDRSVVPVWQTNPDSIGSALSSDFKGIGCPYCAGLKVSKTNRLSDNYPKIANQWHPTLNGERAPNEFTSEGRLISLLNEIRNISPS